MSVNNWRGVAKSQHNLQLQQVNKENNLKYSMSSRIKETPNP